MQLPEPEPYLPDDANRQEDWLTEYERYSEEQDEDE